MRHLYMEDERFIFRQINFINVEITDKFNNTKEVVLVFELHNWKPKELKRLEMKKEK